MADGVAGRVSQSQQQVPGGELFSVVALHVQQVALHREVGEGGVEVELAPEGFYLQTDVAHHLLQVVRADVRVLHIEHILTGPVLVELLQHKAVVLAVDVGVELAVGKGACTTLAELHIGVRVQFLVVEELVQRPFAFFDALAPFHNDGTRLAASQIECGEHSRRAEPYDDGPLVVRPLAILHRRRRLKRHDIGIVEQGSVAVGYRHFHLVIVKHAGLFPGVDGLAQDFEVFNVLAVDAEFPAHFVFNVRMGRYRDPDVPTIIEDDLKGLDKSLALYIIARTSGEGSDRRVIGGDYELSEGWSLCST